MHRHVRNVESILRGKPYKRDFARLFFLPFKPTNQQTKVRTGRDETERSRGPGLFEVGRRVDWAGGLADAGPSCASLGGIGTGCREGECAKLFA